MDLSATNRACYGGPAVRYERDGVEHQVPTAECGAPAWLLGHDVLIYQRITDTEGARVETCDLRTGEIAVVDAFGANRICAGGGVWAIVSDRGYRDSHGTAHLGWSPHAVDDLTGDVAVVLHAGSNTGLGVWDGTTLITLNIVSSWGASFRRGVLIARSQDGQWLRWTRAQGATTLGSLPTVSGCESDDGWNLSWSDYGGVVWPDAHPERAIVWAVDGRNYNARLRREGHLLHIACSRGAGEHPGELRRHEIVLDALTVDGQPAVLVDLRVRPMDVIRVPEFRAASHAVGVLTFGEANAPGLLGVTWWDPRPAVGVFVDLDGPTVDAAARVARTRQVPLYVYEDGVAPWQPSRVPSGAIALVCGYPDGAEPVGATVTRVRHWVSVLQAAGVPCGLVLPAYRQIRGDGTYALGEQQVLDVQAALWDVVVMHRLPLVALFAQARGERDGIEAFPSFAESRRRMRAASPDWRVCPVVAPVVVPPIVVIPPKPIHPEEIIMQTIPNAPTYHADQLRTHPSGGFGIVQANGAYVTILRDGTISEQPEGMLDQERVDRSSASLYFADRRYLPGGGVWPIVIVGGK